LHITHAAVERPLDSDDGSGRVAIRCKSSRSPLKFVVCTLSDSRDQCRLNLKFSALKSKGQTSANTPGGRKGHNQNSQSSKGKYSKKGKAKRRQPDLADPEKGDQASSKEGKKRNEQPKAVAEFSHVENWNHPVHLTGYLINVSQKNNLTPSFEQLREVFQGSIDEEIEENLDEKETDKEEKQNKSNENKVEHSGLVKAEEEENDEEEEDDDEEEEEGAPKEAAEGKKEVETVGGKKRKESSENIEKKSVNASKKLKAEEKDTKQKKETKKQDSKTKQTVATPKVAPIPQPLQEQMTQITKLPSGLQYQEVKLGKGPVVKEGQNLKVRYKGLLQDGHEFDTNMPRGKPLSFVLGSRSIIQGWNIGIQGMRVGGRRNLLIPPHLGYGAKGSPPDIPPNAPLIFEIHLMSAK